MNEKQNVWVALTSMILLGTACNLFAGPARDNVQDAVGNMINDQMQEALGDSEVGELNDLIEGLSGGEWTRSDVPLPPDAEVFGASVGETEGDIVLLETSMSIEEAEAWMIEQLLSNGWIQGDNELTMNQTRVLEFLQGDEGLSLVMNGNLESGGTTISITVFPLE